MDLLGLVRSRSESYPSLNYLSVSFISVGGTYGTAGKGLEKVIPDTGIKNSEKGELCLGSGVQSP